ncbi:MAG: helix-turn-helix transcriptional regulator [Solirubrobacteraceae bacterium]
MPGEGEPHNMEARLLDLVGDVCGLLDIDELRSGLLDALHRALPSHYVSLNDIGPAAGEVVALMRPESPDPEVFARWSEHAHENPLLRYYVRTQGGRSMRFSDVVSPEELHQTALYREVYRPMGVEHQLAFTLPAGPRRVLAIALSRGDRDYSDAERDFADRARPFLIQAYLNAIAVDSLRCRERTPADSGPEPGPAGLTERLLEAGLTQREAESLQLVALGRSNQHVASALGISHRTVGKHLERGFRKLGVTDRSSAAARVWELAGVNGNGSR